MLDVGGPLAVVGGFWEALYSRDWDRIAACFTEDAVYYDVPTGPAAAAVGPVHIVQRLRLGLEPLSGYEHQLATMAAAGDTVFTEHREDWHFATGEVVRLPFVSVQQVRGAQICRWLDYWDLATLMDGAPGWWHERLATADLSWVTDLSES